MEVAGGWVEERVLDPGNPPDWEWRARPWEPHPGMWEKRLGAVKTKRGGPAGGVRWVEQGGRWRPGEIVEAGRVHLLRRHAKYSFTNLWTRRAGLSRGAASVVRSGNIDGADVAAAGWNTSTLYIVSKRLSQLTPAGGLLLW